MMASARTSVIAIAILVQVALLQAQPATSAAKFADLPPRQRFVAWALRYQWWLARDKPVTQAPWPGSASSGISVAYGFFDTPSTRSVAAVPLRQRVYHQTLSLSQQLDLGVRALELTVHDADMSSGTAAPASPSLRVCAKDSSIVNMCSTAQDRTSTDVCAQVLGIAGITAASTGCVANGDELPLAAALQEVAAWLPKKALFGAAPSHHMETVPNNELVLLRINDATTGRSAQAIAEAVQAAFQTLLVTQADVAQYKAQTQSTEWPSYMTLWRQNKRVIVVLDAASFDAGVAAGASGMNVLHRGGLSGAFASSTTAPVLSFTAGASCAIVDSSSRSSQVPSQASFTALRDDTRVFDLCPATRALGDSATPSTLPNDVCNNQAPEYTINAAPVVGELSASSVIDAAQCDLGIAMDMVTEDKMRSFVWSWEEGAGFSTRVAGAVLPAASSSGQWKQATLTSQRAAACASKGTNATSRWVVSGTAGPWEAFVMQSSLCPEGYEFVAPHSKSDNLQLLTALRQENVASVWIAATTILPDPAVGGHVTSGAAAPVAAHSAAAALVVAALLAVATTVL